MTHLRYEFLLSLGRFQVKNDFVFMTRLFRFLNSWPLFALSAVGVIMLLVLTLRPSSELPKIELFPMADKVFHLLAFGLVASALVLDIGRWRRAKGWLLYLIGGIALVGLGVFIELAQEAMKQGRSADVMDFVADVAGILILPVVLWPLIKRCISMYEFYVWPWRGNGKDLSFVKELYFSSFPENERRPWSDFVERISDKIGRMKLLMIYSANRPVGFITWWQLDGVRYIEHFAVSPRQRNSGIGSQAIKEFIKGDDTPVVLEAEPVALGEMACRRIEFYCRCGFYPHREYRYIQPAYAKGLEAVELMLMTTDSGADLQNIEKQLHTTVYGVNQ